MNLVIDVGNTRAKLAVFKQDNIKEERVCSLEEVITQVKLLIKKYSIKACILSSVVDLSSDFIKNLRNIIPVFELSKTSKVPFKNKYKTPDTLGLDRMALIAGAVNLYPETNCLVIDAGTCITFDFVNRGANYFGGAISPGIRMRYNALSDYTSKLPKLTISGTFELIGNTTQSSIHSGVLNGVVNEIDGVINQYRTIYQDLTVVLTGGDAKFLSKQLKNSIFANQNFLLVGLNTILNYNI